MPKPVPPSTLPEALILQTVEEAMSEGTEEEVRLLVLQDRLDQVAAALASLQTPADRSVVWATRGERGPELSVAPRQTGEQLQDLYRQRQPVIFTSATLTGGESFAWIKQLLGAPDTQHTQTETPFHLAQQVLVYLPAEGNGGRDGRRDAIAPQAADDFSADLAPRAAPGPPDLAARLVALLHASHGRALVLLPSRRELRSLRSALQGYQLPWPVLWEGDAERSALVRQFAGDIHSVLVGTSLWEGIDVPGAALSVVVVPYLPFPAADPVVVAQREDAAAAGLDPFLAVDVSMMAIRLKQGWGRLVRAAADRGVLALLDASFVGSSYEKAVRATFPDGTRITGDLSELGPFLGMTPA